MCDRLERRFGRQTLIFCIGGTKYLELNSTRIWSEVLNPLCLVRAEVHTKAWAKFLMKVVVAEDYFSIRKMPYAQKVWPLIFF